MSRLQEVTPIMQQESFKYTSAQMLMAWSGEGPVEVDNPTFKEVLSVTNPDPSEIHALWLQAQNTPNSLPYEMHYLSPDKVRKLAVTKTPVEIFKKLFERQSLAGFRIILRGLSEPQNIILTLGRGVGYLEFQIPERHEAQLNLQIQSLDSVREPQAVVLIDYQCGAFSNLKITEKFKDYQSPSLLKILNVSVAEYGTCQHYIETDKSFVGYVRNQVSVHLNGEGASAQLLGSFNQIQNQTVESETWVYHHQPKTRSQQLYKSVIRDEARTISLAHVQIAKGAIESSAKQMTKALMLSPKAKVDYKPFLDIQCDDVKATHGAAISRFQDEELFYLASRGIKAEEALKLLELAFLTDVKDFLNG